MCVDASLRLLCFGEADLLDFQIDYILVTKGLLPWIKHGDIQPSIKGSDHCPIFVDLHEEIEVDGQRLNLRQQMLGGDPPKQPPRIATRHWDEFSGKQTMLSSFFKKAAQPLATQQPKATTKTPLTPVLDLDPEIEELPPPSPQVTRTSSPPPAPDPQPTRPLKRKESPPYSTSQSSKLSSSIITTIRSAKKQKVGTKTKSGQTILSSFFSAPSSQTETRSKPSQPSNEVVEVDLDDYSLTPTQQSSALSQSDGLEQLEDVLELAGSLDSSSSQTTQTSLSNRSGSSSQSKSTKPTAASWSEIMAPLVAPLCTVHWEPTKELTVNKPGPNKGRKFYVCSRFVTVGNFILGEIFY